MSILWEIFEISVNFFQGFILVFFPYYYLEDKKKRKFYKSPGIAYAIIIATTISIMNKLKSFEHFYAIIYVAIIFVYSFKHLHGTVLKKFLHLYFQVWLWQLYRFLQQIYFQYCIMFHRSKL